MLYDPKTQTLYRNQAEAGKLGLPKVQIAPRPDLDLTQKANLNDLPTEQADGSWVREWTIEQKTAEEIAEQRFVLAAKECSRRIYAVADETAQMNMASMASAGLLTSEQMTAYQSGLQWIAQMRGTWRGLAADTSKDVTVDANWPECHADVVALAGAF